MTARLYGVSGRELDGMKERRRSQLTPLQPSTRAVDARPFVVLVIGQQGAGKTTLMKRTHAALGAECIVAYEPDADLQVHPRYEEVMRVCGIDGQWVLEQAVPTEMHLACWDHLRGPDTRFDVISNISLTDEGWARRHVNGFADQGYRVYVVYIAANESESLVGLASRYQQDLDASGLGGRWIAKERHDLYYPGIPGTAHLLESEALVDGIYVVNRGGYVLFDNHRGPDLTMLHADGARAAVRAWRDLPPTPEDSRWLLGEAGLLLARQDSLAAAQEAPVRRVLVAGIERELSRPDPTPGRTFTANDWIGWRLLEDLGVHRPDLLHSSIVDHQLLTMRQAAGIGIAPPNSPAPPFGQSPPASVRRTGPRSRGPGSPGVGQRADR